MNRIEHAGMWTRHGETVVLDGVHVSGDLRGLLFEARVEQRFRNPGNNNVEIVYTFPLPWGAVLLGVDVRLGDRELVGAVVEKVNAEARYEEALSEGDAAIMLERNNDASYTLNLGNLMAGESCVVTVRYAQTLRFEQNGLRLLLPTVIAPRFGDPVRDGGLRPHQAPVHDLTVEYPFDLVLRLHGELARARVSSPSHSIGMSQGSNDAGPLVTVSLARRGALDRDFVLVVDGLEHDSLGVFARDLVEPDAVVALASFRPRFPAAHASTAIAVKILVDCSGSMAGDSLEAARRALSSIVKRMEGSDRFSLSRFGDRVEHRSHWLWHAKAAACASAQQWVGALAANLGGTEMEAALCSTFEIEPSVSSDVLLVTDGQIAAIDSTIVAARNSGHRLFIVGIGSSAAESHLRRLAEETGGACDFVAPGEAVEPAVLRMFARLRCPRLVDLHVAWPEGVHPAWVAPLPAAVFDGDTVNVFASMPHAFGGAIRLLASRGPGAEPEEIGCVRIATPAERGDALSRMAASVRHAALQGATSAEAVRERAMLAAAYQLVTDQTNFLLVHARAPGEKPLEMPELRKVAQMVPAGWGGVGTVGSAPQMVRKAFASVAACRTGSAADMEWGFDTVDAAHVPGIRFSKPVISREPSSAFAFDPHRDLGVFTPKMLMDWLDANDPVGWPTTVDSLEVMGVSDLASELLRQHVANQARAPEVERSTVMTFLFAVCFWYEISAVYEDRLARGEPDDDWSWLFALMHPVPDELRCYVDEELLKMVVTWLHGMPREWWTKPFR